MPVPIAIAGAVSGLAGGAASVISATRGGGGGGYQARPLTQEEIRLQEMQTQVGAALQTRELDIREAQARAMNAATLDESAAKKWLGIGGGVFLLGILFLIFKKKKLLTI